MQLSQFLRAEFRPPDYLARSAAGIDISASGIKIACIQETVNGLELHNVAEAALPPGTITGGEIADQETLIKTLRALAKEQHFSRANIALPEARGYLFEAQVPRDKKTVQRTAIEQHLEEYVPLPVNDVVFDFAPLTKEGDGVRIVGVGYAARVIEASVRAVEEAGIEVMSAESETFALPRSLVTPQSDETILIVDIGKSTTKLLVATGRLPRFVNTFEVGGHALTLAIQKYFGASEDEARKIKLERGIVPGNENQEYLAAMLSTVSVIKDETSRRLEYWQSHADDMHPKVSRIVLVGGNASVKGLPEYLADALQIPVTLGNVLTNFAPPTTWRVPLEKTEALAYATAIGLALRDYGK